MQRAVTTTIAAAASRRYQTATQTPLAQHRRRTNQLIQQLLPLGQPRINQIPSIRMSTTASTTSSNSSTVLPSTIDWSSVALGTYQAKGTDCFNVVLAAIQMGYKRIDSATVYRNEKEVGDAVRKSGVERAKLHITSKLSPAQMESSDTAYEAIKESLKNFEFEYLDSYLVHWPGRGGLQPDDSRHPDHRRASWAGLERGVRDGLLRTIGVSNFEVRHLEELKKVWTIKPIANQIEMHPFIYQTQRPIIDWCRANDIRIQAYSPLGSSSGVTKLLQHEVIVRLSKACDRTPAQILIKWSHQHGFEVLPKTKTVGRLGENALGCDTAWSLSSEQMEELDHMETKYGTQRFCWNPQTIQ